MLILPAPLSAHEIIAPVGATSLAVGKNVTAAQGELVVEVIPSGPFDTCTVFARVTIDDTSVLSGSGEQTAKSPKFTLKALKAGTTAVTLYFNGLTNDEGGECPAVRQQQFVVNVVSSDTSSSAPNAGSDADPVNTFSGELYMEEDRPDLWLGGPMGLYFQRYYGSYLRRSFVLGDLGSNWRHNFDARLQWNGTRAVYTSWRGRVVLFDNMGGEWVQQNVTEVPYQVLTGPGVDARLYDPESDLVYFFDYTQGGVTTGKLVRIEDGHGNHHVITYTAEGLLDTISDGLGRSLSFSYHPATADDQIRKISAVSDGTRSVTFAYQDAIDEQLLTSFTDARGNATTYHYADTSGNADHGLMERRVRPRGNVPYSQTFYDTTDQFRSGRVKTQTSALGDVTRFSYSDSGLSTTVTEETDGVSREHAHSEAGRLLTHQDENGNSLQLAYDADGRRSSFDYRDGTSVSSDFDPVSGRPSQTTHEDGTVTSKTYITREVDGVLWRDLASTTFPDGSVETYSYDSQGNLLSKTTPRGSTWQWTYNSHGQILTETDPTGAVTTLTYNADGTLATRTSDAGVSTTFFYDGLRRPVRSEYGDGSFSTLAYDANDNIIEAVDELGQTRSFTYDANNNIATLTDATGAVTSFSYDGLDRLVSVTDFQGAVSQIVYDSRGRIAKTIQADGAERSFTYNSRGNLTETTDALGNVWRQSYSADGVVESQTDPLGNTLLYSNDANGRPVAITSPGGGTDVLTRDALGRVVEVSDPLGQNMRLSLDPEGLPLSQIINDTLVRVSYGRDERGRLTEVSDADNRTWRRDRDIAGRIVALVDPLNRSQQFDYDARGRLHTTTFAGGLGSMQRGYDNAGKLISKAYSDGLTLQFTYDELDRLTAANEISLAYQGSTQWVTNSNGLLQTYDVLGRLSTLTVAPGKTVHYDYDAAGRVVAIEDWNQAVTTFSYDAAGQLLSISRPSGVQTAFFYNADGLPIIISTSGLSSGQASIILGRDANGRVTQATHSLPLTAMVSDAAALQSFMYDDASQISAFSYDAEGRMLGDADHGFTWDLASRLTGVSTDGGPIAYQYDAMGKLIERSAGDGQREYIWNYALDLPSISVERHAGADFRYYIHTPDGQLIYSLDASGADRRDYHYDETGNTLFLTTSTGEVSDAYAYSPYGKLLQASGASHNPFTWQGKWGIWREPDTDAYFMRARWFDASSMRFLSRDPARLVTPKELNPYQYASLNPIKYIDPTGLEPQAPGKPPPVLTPGGFLGCSASLTSVASLDETLDAVLVAGARGRFLAASKPARSLANGLKALSDGTAGVEGARANVTAMKEMYSVRAAELRNANKGLTQARSVASKASKVLNVGGAVLAGGAEYVSNNTATEKGRVINAVGVGGTSLLLSTANPSVAAVNAASGIIDVVAENTIGVKPGAAEVINNATRVGVALGESWSRGDCRPMQSLSNKMVRGDFGVVTQGISSAGEWFGENVLYVFF